MTINLNYVNEEESKTTFVNTGDMVDAVVLTKSYNLLSDKVIDLRFTNIDATLYINLGTDDVTPQEINDLYNGLNTQ